MTSSRTVSRLRRTLTPDRRRARELTGFCTVALVLLAYLFRDQILRGHVLGQADILYEFLPWAPLRPIAWRIHNRMLADVPTVFYPFLFHAREAVLHGEFPLWSGAMGAGHPFFASFQSAVLSPFTLLHYLLPFPASITADVAARLLAGGLGMFVYLRSLPLRAAAATFGGVAFLLNPFSIVWMEHPLSAVAAALPWLLWTVDRCVRRPGARACALVAVVTAGMLFAGHPETAFKIVLLAGAYAAYRGTASRALLRTLALVSSGMILGAVLASVQILPFLEYARESRILAYRRETGTLLTSPLAAFVTTFVPDFYGSPLRNRFVLEGTNYIEQQLYPGIVTWLFAVFAVTHRRWRGHALFFLSSAAAAVLIMYGTAVAHLAAALVPPLQVAALSRFGLLGITGLIVAGAMGLDALRSSVPRAGARLPAARQPLLAAAAALGIAGVVAAFLWVQHELLLEGRQWRHTTRSAALAAGLLTAAASLAALSSTLTRTTVTTIAVALLGLDLVVFADRFHAAMPRAQVFPPIAALAVPHADRTVFRVAGWGDTLIPNTALVYGLQDFRSYDGIGIRRYTDLLDIGFRFDGGTHQLVNAATPHLIDLLNIKYILAPPGVELPAERFRLLLDGPTRLYENERVQARAFLVDRYTVLQGDDARRAMRGGLDLREVAVLERPLAPALEPERRVGEPDAVEILAYADHRVAVRTRASGRRLLVLSDVYYPGWVATVDGADAPIHVTDYAFRGVSVPAGEHVVEFRYRPGSVRTGAILSTSALIVVVVLACTRGRRPARRALARRTTGSSVRPA